VRRWVTLGVMALAGCGLPMNGLGPGGDGTPDGGAVPTADASDVEAASDDGGGPGDPEAGAPAEDGPSDAPTADVTSIPDAPPPLPDAHADASPTAVNDALEFASGAYVEVGQMPIPGDFTVEAWVRPKSVTGETSIVAQDRDKQAAGQFRLGLVGTGQLFFIMSDGNGNTEGLFTGTGFALQTSQPVPTGTWTHVAVTKSKQTFTLLVNGAQAAQFKANGPPMTYGGPAVPMRIAARVGSDGSSPDELFDGTIDEVRFWNVARTQQDIAANMSHTVTPSDPSLLAYWRFDDGAGGTANDEEGHHPGSLVTGPVWVVSTAF
jgi:hypothetical protein